jgi:hypothetical protein
MKRGAERATAQIRCIDTISIGSADRYRRARVSITRVLEVWSGCTPVWRRRHAPVRRGNNRAVIAHPYPMNAFAPVQVDATLVKYPANALNRRRGIILLVL